jgi:hypothetical protein
MMRTGDVGEIDTRCVGWSGGRAPVTECYLAGDVDQPRAGHRRRSAAVPRGHRWLGDQCPVRAAQGQGEGQKGSLEPSFALSMARKDVGLVLEAAQQAGLEAHLALAVARIMDRAIEAGHGDEDLAAVYYGAR